MTTVADYKVLMDKSVIVEEGTEHEISNFFMPDNYVRGTNLARPVLSYRAAALGSRDGALAPFVRFEVQTQASVILETVILRSASPATQTEVFSGNLLNDLIANNITFKVLQGRLWVSDVILWYQVRI